MGEKIEISEHWRDEWSEGVQRVHRPNWDNYFMSMAMLAATRSIDAQTQCGSVLVKDKRIIGMGYNSFPRNGPDDILPNTRPHKYDWIIHAERNALYNSVAEPDGGICYVNGHPCLECLKALYQNGIWQYVCTPGRANMLEAMTDEQRDMYHSFIDLYNIEIKEIQIPITVFTSAQQIFHASNGVSTF